MIVASDTNILLDVLLPDPAFKDSSLAALNEVQANGFLVTCEIVLAEVGGQFDKIQDFVRFLSETNITPVPASTATCREAGIRWRRYARGRGSRRRDRIVPDFLIGAHALFHAEALLTRDLGFYRRHFPELRLLP